MKKEPETSSDRRAGVDESVQGKCMDKEGVICTRRLYEMVDSGYV